MRELITKKFTADQLACIRAAWVLFKESNEPYNAIQDALEITNVERGFQEDGEVTESYSEEIDPVCRLINETDTLLMSDEIESLEIVGTHPAAELEGGEFESISASTFGVEKETNIE